jgi:hypothetical protein
MGLGSLNPGCQCPCCEPCTDDGLDWYGQICDPQPEGLKHLLRGVILDFGPIAMTEPVGHEATLDALYPDLAGASGNWLHGQVTLTLPGTAYVSYTTTDKTVNVALTSVTLCLAIITHTSKPCRRAVYIGVRNSFTITGIYIDGIAQNLAHYTPTTFTAAAFPSRWLHGVAMRSCEITGGVDIGTATRIAEGTNVVYPGVDFWFYQLLPPDYISGTSVALSSDVRAQLPSSVRVQSISAVFADNCDCPPDDDYTELDAELGVIGDGPYRFRTYDHPGNVLGVIIDNVANLEVSGLPDGLEYNGVDSTIVGIPIATPGSYDCELSAVVQAGEYIGCAVRYEFTLDVTDCPDPTDYDELGATLAPIAAHSTEPRPFSKAGSLGNIARFLCTDCDYDGATVEGLPAGLDAHSGPGTWGDANLWFVGTPDSGVTNGLYTITLRTTVTDGDHEGCEILREYEIEVTD